MSATWTSQPWIALDFETTGVNPYTDRIVSYACLVIGPSGEIIDGDGDIVNAKVLIPDEAAAIHGITNEIAERDGCDIIHALRHIKELIADHAAFAPMVIYNAAFDWPLLLAEAERHQVEILPPAGILDPFIIDKQVDKYRKGGRKLTAVAAHYGVPLGDAAHGAAADAVAANGVMRAIVDRYPEIGERTLTSMMLWQTRIADEQRLDFQDWRRRNSDPAFEVERGWPIPVREGMAA